MDLQGRFEAQIVRGFVRVPLSFLPVIIVGAASSSAHEWEHRHHDEDLSLEEARALGFEVLIDKVRWYDQSQKAELDTIGILIHYPISITGEQIVSADYSEGCDPLHSNIVEELADDDLPTEIVRYSTDHVFPVACAGNVVFLGHLWCPNRDHLLLAEV